jgi:hypothetical protein
VRRPCPRLVLPSPPTPAAPLFLFLRLRIPSECLVP